MRTVGYTFNTIHITCSRASSTRSARLRKKEVASLGFYSCHLEMEYLAFHYLLWESHATTLRLDPSLTLHLSFPFNFNLNINFSTPPCPANRERSKRALLLLQHLQILRRVSIMRAITKVTARLDSHMVILVWRQFVLEVLASVVLSRRSDARLFSNTWKCKSKHQKRQKNLVI